MKKTNYINQISILLFMLCSIAASATGISPRTIDPIKGLPVLEVISLTDGGIESKISAVSVMEYPVPKPAFAVGARVDIPELDDDVMDFISRAAVHRKDAQFLANIGGDAEFIKIINKYAGPCKGCDSANSPAHMSWMKVDEYLDAVHHYGKTYHGKPGFGAVLDDLKLNNSPKKQDGAFSMIKSLKDNNVASDDIIKFEAKFADSIDDAVCAGCTYDVEFVGNELNEFKSFSKSSLSSVKSTILNGGTSGFYNQFKGYLQSGNFKYNFNVQPGVKLDNLDDARKFFRDVIAEKAEELWMVNSDFFIQRIPNLATDGSDLATKVNNLPLSDPFFNFIQ